MLDWLHAGRLAGIVAYDDSRLNRNAENALRLFRLCAARGVLLWVDDSRPDGRALYDDPSAKTFYGFKGLMSEDARARMSKKMRDQMRFEFEQGGHRGLDPMGYKTLRDERYRPLRPRTLAIVPEEAEVVRRVFALLATHPFSESAEILQREGVRRRVSGPWTTAAIKDLYRRREMYRGNVTSRRGSRSARAGTRPSCPKSSTRTPWPGSSPARSTPAPSRRSPAARTRSEG
jgi:DNA invertase Pin-like site-specific DNA recombinase